MVAIYNTTVPQINRAKILMISADQSHADISTIAKYTDALILQIGGEDRKVTNTDNGIYEDSGWKVRCDQTNLPVLAQFNLRAGNYLDRQQTEEAVKKLIIEENYNNNLSLVKIIDLLRTAPYTFSTLDANTGWKKFHALVLYMYDISTATGEANDLWQAYDLQTVLDPILALKASNRFPNVPVIIMSYPAFIQKYGSNLYQYLWNHRHDVSLGFAQIIWDQTPGPIVDVKTFWETLVWYPSETFKYSYVPWGFGSDNVDFSNILFHWFTSDRFGLKELTDSTGNPLPVDAVLWCDTKEELYKLLKFSPTIVTPPVTTDLEVRLKEIEDWRVYITDSFRNL